MQAVKAVYDGENIKWLQPVPVKDEWDVIVTFVEPKEKKMVRPPFGYNSMKGKIWMAEDFNEPMEEFEEYM